jgi:ribonucleoside-diphosphate reductase alpha chain
MSSSSSSIINNAEEMTVVKRNGQTEIVQFDKILNRIRRIGTDTGIKINFAQLAVKVIDQLYSGILSTKIDELLAEQCSTLLSTHPDYGVLAGRIIITNHNKNTSSSFSQTVEALYDIKDIFGQPSPAVSRELWELVQSHGPTIDAMIDYERDYLIDYFGFKTLERSYLLKVGGKVVERPQHMWMRVACGIHGAALDLARIKETYDAMSQKFFTHATPTLFNAGTPCPQLASCFLVQMESDSIDGIYNTLKECALISKRAGGIGIHIHNVRAAGSQIRGSNGVSTGIVPMLRVFNATAKYVDQGNKRNGSFAIYLEPWHADVEAFLRMRMNHGDEELKARDLFYALWIPDLFMRRVKEGGHWTLMCPDECPGLADVHGAAFDALYVSYEEAGKGRKQMMARDLWNQILDSQMETGTPYMLYKDAVNAKSNQQNVGTIKSSNLCTEITEYSDENETAVCNLASLALPSFLKEGGKDGLVFDFALLERMVRVATFNINRIIDINYYPTEKTRRSNLRHRPIGLGVQGLADVFMRLGLPFDSAGARELNLHIFETIYYSALTESCSLAKAEGPYETFAGSPASEGRLQYDLWGREPTAGRHDWAQLKADIRAHGLRNALLVAPMPTASTSQILGFNECFEPITSNIFSRRTMAGEFIVTNKYLIKDLLDLGLWNDKIKNNIIANNGSVQQIDVIPQEVRNKYRTVWEMSMRTLLEMAADRGAFICQSQSLNLWIEEPTRNKMSAMHFYAWEKGLKTGIYYLRRRARHTAQQFSIEPEKLFDNNAALGDDEEGGVCESCSA